MPHLFPKEKHVATPWKNGGGQTIEIAIAPAGATLNDFDWRISVATIAASGAFSSFPGIDRSLCLVAGDDVLLDIDGRQVALSAQQPSIAFAGEAAVHATVSGGATTDFNVMSRRARYRHRLQRLTFSGAHTVVPEAGATVLLFVADGERLECRGRECATAPLSLRRFDSALFDGAEASELQLQASGAVTVLMVELMEIRNG